MYPVTNSGEMSGCFLLVGTCETWDSLYKLFRNCTTLIVASLWVLRRGRASKCVRLGEMMRWRCFNMRHLMLSRKGEGQSGEDWRIRTALSNISYWNFNVCIASLFYVYKYLLLCSIDNEHSYTWIYLVLNKDSF